MSFLLDSCIKVSVVLALALVTARLSSRRSAAFRHAILSVAICSALAVPLFVGVLPAWEWTTVSRIAMNPGPANAAEPSESALVVPDVDGRTAPVPPSVSTTPSSPTRFDWFRFAAAIWGLGSLVSVLAMAVGSIRLFRLSSAARPVNEESWEQIADEITRDYGLVRPVRLRRSQQSSLLAAWGLAKPEVLLPSTSCDWAEERIRVVLSHEFAHIRRRDWIIQSVSEILRALYWFNPLVWIACAHLRLESEQACDDLVLSRGVDGPEYAQHLLDLARTLHPVNHTWMPALSMARASTLKRRFNAILNPAVNRHTVSASTVAITIAGSLALTMPITTFRTAAQSLSQIAPAGVVQGPGGLPTPAFSLGTPVQTPPGSTPAQVEGIVTRWGTNEPMAGVTVELTRTQFARGAIASVLLGAPNAPLPTTAVTSTGGRFTLRDIPPGDYRLTGTFTGSSYMPGEYGQRDPSRPGTTLTLAAGQMVRDVKLELASTGSISGRIVDRDGDPVGRARVIALSAVYQNGLRTISLDSAVYTDDMGQYRLFWLPPGEYYVAAKPEDPQRRAGFPAVRAPGVRFAIGSETAPIVVARRTLSTGEVIEETSQYVFNTGLTTTPWRTPPIMVAPGAAVTGVDISVASAIARIHHVRGKVLNGGSGTQVSLRARSPSFSNVVPRTTTDANGAFDVSGVIPGMYDLVASGNAGSGIVAVEVNNGNVEGLTVSLEPAFSVSGKVSIEGRPTTNNPDLTHVRVAVDPSPNVVGSGLAAAAGSSFFADANGVFTATGLAPNNWDYRIAVSVDRAGTLPETAYVKSVRYGSVDVLENSDPIRQVSILHLSAPIRDQLDVVIGLDGATLEGTTVNEKRELAPRIAVVLVPEGQRQRRNDLYRITTADDLGRFRFTGITPGDYQVYALEDADSFAWRNTDAFSRYQNRGKTVHLTGGSRATIEITVISQGR